MIKADKDNVVINGNTIEILEQFIAVTQAVREILEGAFDEARASKTMDAIYELSKFTDEELEARQGKEIAEIILKNL